MNSPHDLHDLESPPTRDDTPFLAATSPLGHPERIGRYRIEKVLGEGGFGRVYLAHDDQLNRPVAIKVPRKERVSRPQDAEAYLTEARVVASLDHPHIVPVYDVGSTEDGLCYVVSKLIEGSDLAGRLHQNPLSHLEAAELLATVAEALHHAHGKGLVHRDIKPANILLDTAAKPYVADFGLALKDADFGKGAGFAGTPAYMSPEQARGEGHRVDGRSDIFSLGVVFYELLVGRRPFKADPQGELLGQITSIEVRPPRQVNDAIPKELERICLKALAKRASERYTTAKDMADDLRHFLGSASVAEKATVSFKLVDDAAVPTPVPSPTPVSDQRPMKIVPKGLRAFDANDADFFLELLPGPRDRDGLPEGLRFWKTRIEETDADNTFSVGVIYGPSGCGKSSLMKAGLLPRLADHAIAVYVEATADDTEARLLKWLRKHCPDVPEHLGVIEALAALRRGYYLPAGKTVVLILDQFEQWLHAMGGDANTELVQALRHCDGGRVQCIVMVRDDFGMATTRFMRALEIRLVEGDNFATIDLFDPIHARKVLAAFGRSYGRLPDNLAQCSKEQDSFLDQAVAGLAQEGKVISVRLALFAEMMKGKTWVPATLKEVGGTEGVGVTFLEETFTASSAPPQHRLHQKAAQAVLKALLPEAGTDIKGHMRSHGELLVASGYVGRPKDFDDLIRILDGEIRLITPTDPEGKGEAFISQVKASDKFYQLTHDYLVPSLRDWLTSKQKETRRGRAELLLADRAAVWNARPENRQLPSLLQWFRVRTLTRKQNWTPPQRKMMRKAGRYHTVRGLVVASCLILVACLWYVGNGENEAEALRIRLLDVNTNDVPRIVETMAPYRRWIDPLLRDDFKEAAITKDARKQLHASLALLPVDATQVEYLYGRLLDAEPQEVPVIRDALAPHSETLSDKLWVVVESPEKGKESQRLRAAAALAMYDPESGNWANGSRLVVQDLVRENPVFLGQWSEAFRRVKNSFHAPLADVFRDQRPERASERTLATNLLADYAADNPAVLANLLMDADEKQFAVIYPKLKEHGEQGSSLLTGELDRKLPADVPSSDERREKLAKRQANAAVALLRLNQPYRVWPVLRHSSDPRARSYLIHRLSPLGADANAIVKRLDEEPDITIRRALMQSLGEFSEQELSLETRKALLPKLQDTYRTEADPGLHASAEWLLRTWKQEAWLKQVNEEWKDNARQRGRRMDEIRQEKTPQWYVNGQGQTMVVIPGPVKFLMGSPLTEAGRQDCETQHHKRISRMFAVAAKSVTAEQFRQFDKDYTLRAEYTRTTDLPVVGTSWYQAAVYCNWLSKEEGIDKDQWCYEVDAEGQVTKLKENYLSLSGYRLPTEAEMEYATRAGAGTSRYFGETEDLLAKYAWYNKSSQEKTWPVGSLKPNDLGFFDVQGNAFTWCQENYKEYPQDEEVSEDQEDELEVVSTRIRVLRGGSFTILASNVRSAYRNRYVPANRVNNVGFRPARTFR